MAEEERARKDGDMVLAPNEWMLVRDQTKGNVDVFVGPCKTGLSGTDQPVVFDERTKRFQNVTLERAIQTFMTAPEGFYIVLKNPAVGEKHPAGQGKATNADLTVGRKVNIPGPVSFPLWPGQMAKVLKGHHIRSNQYLLVRVYDAEAARQNWKKAVVQPVGSAPSELDASKDPDFSVLTSGGLTMGQLLVIRGTDVAFYIPPTGVEVVPDEKGQHVREAVTLERLEYVLLRDQNGNKRYEQGPAVVFPEPTEVFSEREVEKDGKVTKTRKFRAIELNENSGIYIKVIADYSEGGQDYKVGQELFITGREQMIYFPREEHAIVKYDTNEIHYGIAIPAGEARYVLDRNKGGISLERGATIFLPDPRNQVIVRRILDYKTVSLLYPGNHVAIEHNAQLAGVDVSTYMSSSSAVAEAAAMMLMAVPGTVGVGALGAAYADRGATGPQGPQGSLGISNAISVGDSPLARGLGNSPARGFSGDAFQRKSQYTEPRTITLPTKFDGAVSSDIWPGYAMMLVRKTGERRVFQGPGTVLFEYDEQPQILTLSRGKPKTTDNLLRTAFLLTRANKVSDIVEVETSDFCKLKIKVSYRVNFEGDPDRWFSVENYTKFLTDHMRSKLRSSIKQIGVEKFYANAEPTVRDVVLGKSVDAVDGRARARAGTSFEENGMRIYDVEVLGVELDNKDIATEITNSQREVIRHALTLASSRRTLEFSKEAEDIKRQTEAAKLETARALLKMEQEKLTSQLELDLARLASSAKTAQEQHQLSLTAERSRGEVEETKLRIERAETEQEIAMEQARLDQRKAWLEAEVKAVVDKAKAVDPALVAALSSFGEQAMIEKVAEAMSPLAMIKQAGVMDVLGELLKGTKLGDRLLVSAPKNGSAQATPRS